LPAFTHLESLVARWPQSALTDSAFYESALEGLRHRIRACWSLDGSTDIVFAPSGTDLEYVPLALAGPAVNNVLVGSDEVGSGCALAASGRCFAGETALVSRTAKGAPLAGMEDTRLQDIPVRDECGRPVRSADMTQALETTLSRSEGNGRSWLVHAVYGSKTGLVLPEPDHIDYLRSRFPGARFVVDACQARISGSEIRGLLARDCLVLLTGSKFMGGPPFSGIALVPSSWRPARALPAGLGFVFRRPEWPAHWPGCECLPHGTNAGLLLRLSAAVFELERFLQLDGSDVSRVIGHFGDQVRRMANRLAVPLVAPCLEPGALHTATLATLDLSRLPSQPDFATAQRWHRVLAARGLRLGQPVKCVRDRRGGWGGTLRLSLSMPLIGELAGATDAALAARFGRDMGRMADVIEAAQRPVVA